MVGSDPEPRQPPDPTFTEDEEGPVHLLRRNLARDYGCKRFMVGVPILGIRAPRDRAGQITREDLARIGSILEEHAQNLRIEEVAEVYLLGDRSYTRMEPARLRALVFGEKGADVGQILNRFARSEKRKAGGRITTGRRAEVLAQGKRGRYVRFRHPQGKARDVAVAPTLRAAAAHSHGGGGVVVRESDLREKVRRRRVTTLICIVLDASHSMEGCAEATKKVAIELLKDAYQRRDKVGLISCSGRRSRVILPFTSAVVMAKRSLDEIEYGGTTPLAHGLITAHDLLEREVGREPSATPIMVLITDGSANVPLMVGGNVEREATTIARGLGAAGIHLLVIDVSQEGSDLALAIGKAAEGRYVKAESPSEEAIYAAIREDQAEAFSRGDPS